MGIKGKQPKTEYVKRPEKVEPPRAPEDVERGQQYSDWLIQDHRVNMSGSEYDSIEDSTVVSAMPVLRIVRDGGIKAFMVIKDFETVKQYVDIKKLAERVWSSKDVSRLSEKEFAPELIFKSDEAKDFKGSCRKCGYPQKVEHSTETICKWRGCGGIVTEATNG